MIIQGNKINLRDWKLEDLHFYKSWLLGDQEWKKWDAPYYNENANEHEITESIDKLRNKIVSASFDDPRRTLVIADRENNFFLGQVNSYWISKETNWLAVGIIIFDPNYWRHGIGYEALQLWINHVFNTRPELIRLDLQTWSGNYKMMNLASKLGFSMEGRFRKARIVDGQYYDSIQYGILKEEWKT